MRLARHRHRAEQAVAGRFAHCARKRRAGKRDELAVLGEQLDQVAHPVEFDDVRTQHRAREWVALADALRPIRLEEERPIDLVGLDFQPDLFILAVDVEKARLLLGVPDDFGERFLLRCDRSCRRGRCDSGDGRRAHFHASGLGRSMAGAGGDRGGIFGRGARRTGCGDCGGGQRRRIGCRDAGAAAGQQRCGGECDREFRNRGELCGHDAFA